MNRQLKSSNGQSTNNQNAKITGQISKMSYTLDGLCQNATNFELLLTVTVFDILPYNSYGVLITLQPISVGFSLVLKYMLDLLYLLNRPEIWRVTQLPDPR